MDKGAEVPVLPHSPQGSVEPKAPSPHVVEYVHNFAQQHVSDADLNTASRYSGKNKSRDIF